MTLPSDAERRAFVRLQHFAVVNEVLAPYTTYRVGGPAALFATPRRLDDLALVADVAAEAGLPVLVIGRGSNLLVADDGYRGIAVSLQGLSDHVEIAGNVVTAAACVALPVLARRTAAAGLAGFEWAVGVPGSVGGAVRMNAGGHGSDMAASLSAAHLFDLRTGARAWVCTPALGLRFRGSSIAAHQVVLEARLTLQPGDVDTSEELISEIVRWRREHQPGGQNAGSVFVNPIPGELAAAELIDRLGLRGFRIGTAHVSEKHANFIQCDVGGRASDVRAVMEHVRSRVQAETGHLLRSEVRLVGFADVAESDEAGVQI